jgi:hypothetical protein
MIGLTVCVDYGDLLAVTLPRNARGFERVVVATTEADRATLDIVADVPNAVAFTTDAFTRDGATFNKGLAIEEAIEFFGRESLGWLCLLLRRRYPHAAEATLAAARHKRSLRPTRPRPARCNPMAGL